MLCLTSVESSSHRLISARAVAESRVGKYLRALATEKGQEMSDVCMIVLLRKAQSGGDVVASRTLTDCEGSTSARHDPGWPEAEVCLP